MVAIKRNTLHNLTLQLFCLFVFSVVMFNSSKYNMMCNLLYIPFAAIAATKIVNKGKLIIGGVDSWFALFSITSIISSSLVGNGSFFLKTCYSSISLYTIIFFMRQIFTEEDIKPILDAVVIGALGLGLWSIVVRSDAPGGRLGDETANSINVGISLAFCSIILIQRVIQKGGKRDFILYILSMIMIFLTKTRSVLLLSTGISIVIFLFANNSKEGIKKRRIRKTEIFAVLVLLLAVGFYSGFFQTYLNRFQVIFSELTGDRGALNSTAMRMRLKSIGWSEFVKRPLFGHGVGSTKMLLEGSYFHDNFIEILYEMGVVGLVFFYVPYIICLLRSIKAKNMLFISIIIFILGIGFFDVFFHNKLFYILVGVCLLKKERGDLKGELI